jgi:hypothetical protein
MTGKAAVNKRDNSEMPRRNYEEKTGKSSQEEHYNSVLEMTRSRSFISGNTLIGTRHLYWILTGPSFAVQLKSTWAIGETGIMNKYNYSNAIISLMPPLSITKVDAQSFLL